MRALNGNKGLMAFQFKMLPDKLFLTQYSWFVPPKTFMKIREKKKKKQNKKV